MRITDLGRALVVAWRPRVKQPPTPIPPPPARRENAIFLTMSLFSFLLFSSILSLSLSLSFWLAVILSFVLLNCFRSQWRRRVRTHCALVSKVFSSPAMVAGSTKPLTKLSIFSNPYVVFLFQNPFLLTLVYQLCSSSLLRWNWFSAFSSVSFVLNCKYKRRLSIIKDRMHK